MPSVPRETPGSSGIIITKQPECASVPAGCTVTLDCSAIGPTPLQYQWFEGKEEIVGATQSVLLIDSVKSGIYVCRVNDEQNRYVFSNWAKVKVHFIKSAALPQKWQGELVIGLQPEPSRVKVGQRASLMCVAFGIPAPKYQWYKNGIQLPHQTKEELTIAAAEMRHHGSYLCAVTNNQGQECWSSAADISVVENISFAVSLPSRRVKSSHEGKAAEKSTPVYLMPATHQDVRLCATDKVALLIGNMNYVNHPRLVATMMDVFELSNLLQQLDFRVVSLLDLTKEEMQSAVKQFLQLLDNGVYALFYYAGHGYECSGRNYMVPVNAPNPYRPENCINVQKILCRMQEKNTALNVLLLDMCRKWYNQDYLPSDLQPLAPTGNIVYGYATCEDAEAYEVQDGEHSSGIFMKYLKRHILKKEKVTQILENVSEDMGKDKLITGKQVMEIRHTLKERRALTDEICATGHTVQLHVRNERWRRANELPERRTIHFPCGVEVELSCSAVFSNVMTIYVNIKARPSQVSECKVSLQKPQEFADSISDLDRDSSQISSLLSSLDGSQQSDTTLKLCGLHKLKQALILRVTLQYQSCKEKPKLEEIVDVDLGLPLVAQLELYRTMPATGAEGGTTSNSQVSAVAPASTVTKDASRACGSGVQKAANKQEGMHSAHPARRLNEPEENDESEISK
ncbi:mucosa-associated lymphoid tissue lymphoma translocation protein 1 [Pristis pectinata]|uniref:mucosa-associated lymphoid tissue lymphoma translocation protein 1 n=1 Tax=Pristis pectinata TaxID=685728 RepID=UPI00223E31C6|nr:mucosa-associated lymphoid tissue lymphoma translocation protein 1 [Pristis pectinata]